MPTVTYIEPDGNRITIEHAEGTLMEIALDNDVDGIEGSCGGVCSCSTCHVRIPQEWREKVGNTNTAEQDLLDFKVDADERSRLGCQVELTPELDGLVVQVEKL